MSFHRTVKKQFKSGKSDKSTKSNSTHKPDSQNDTLPLSLKHYISPQISALFGAKWFQTAQEYFTNPPEIHIQSIDTKEIRLLNILGELRDYLNGQSSYPSTATQGPDSTKEKELRKIRAILANIDPQRITRTQRRALRKYIEITQTGREILKDFYGAIATSDKMAPDMELIFNPYTSLVNLAEIYAQCTEYSQVRYSVPELGILDAEINLYYPPAKRDLYLSSTNTHNDWLPDALCRVCFFNRLLGTKKQPRAIHVFLADFRKEFMHVSGKADLVFTPSEINTGVCDMTDIMITRAEESLKTLLHELIHFHSLDFKHAAHDDFCAGLFNITTEQSSFNLFEAHTECLASILHCLTRAIHPGTQPTSHSDFLKKFRQIFAAQIYYTMKKAAHILAKSGCHSYMEFTTPADKNTCSLRENTNVFSYFFVKSFIYLGLGEWLSGCCSNRTARFIDTPAGQETLKRIIESGYKNRILEKIIDKEINLEHQHSSSRHAANNSLKMVHIG
jgi:hypothetical protein